MISKRTIRDIDMHDRIVMVRSDFNVPINNGQITDDYRIRQSIPTIQYLREHGCKIVIISHLGRPSGRVDPTLSLEPVASRLSELLGIEVKFLPVTIGDQVNVAVKAMNPTEVLLLENLRFNPGEEANDREFARLLSEPVEYYVQDGFGVVHRAHASTSSIYEFLPSVAGFLLENEIRQLSIAIENPIRPLTTIIGGSKISDKIDLINRFLTHANVIVVAGAMANTFLKASGHEIGRSVHDGGEIEEAIAIIKLAQESEVELIIPFKDVGVASDANVQAERRDVWIDQVGPEDMILDFGPQSTEEILKMITRTGTVIWNGPLGMIELPQFTRSTEQLARFIAQQHINCVVGGGDTAGFIDQLGLTDQYTHVSTGGGASLEFLAGKEMPGISALMDK